MAKGGKREGAGRKAGVPNRKTQDLLAAIEETGDTPIQYLVKVFQDKEQDDSKRIDAAKAAAPYVHHKLSAMELTGKDGESLGFIGFTEQERINRLIKLALEGTAE